MFCLSIRFAYSLAGEGNSREGHLSHLLGDNCPIHHPGDRLSLLLRRVFGKSNAVHGNQGKVKCLNFGKQAKESGLVW